MTFAVPAAFYSAPAVILLLFLLLPTRVAVCAALIGSWLFLPNARYHMSGLPDYDKVTVASASTLLGVALFGSGRLVGFRPSWVDLPMAYWCLSPMLASLANHLGVYDGLSSALDHVIIYGIPYLLGRICFTDSRHLETLAVAILVGGLIYAPLCIFEMRMSPQLHRMLYGYHPHGFVQTRRWGGWRPTVFMQTGLMVAIWMAAASFIAVWLSSRWPRSKMLGVPLSAIAVFQVTVTVLCKSTGALIALFIVWFGFMSTSVWRTRLVLAVLLLSLPAYVTARLAGFSGQPLVELARPLGLQRAHSLETRLEAEELLVARAKQRPLLGWGGWGRARVHDDRGRDIAVTDSLWVIAVGKCGVLGAAAIITVLLVPTGLLLARLNPSQIGYDLSIAPLVALTGVTLLFAYDCMLNAMVNPVFLCTIGACCGFWASRRRVANRGRAVAHVPEQAVSTQ